MKDHWLSMDDLSVRESRLYFADESEKCQTLKRNESEFPAASMEDYAGAFSLKPPVLHQLHPTSNLCTMRSFHRIVALPQLKPVGLEPSLGHCRQRHSREANASRLATPLAVSFVSLAPPGGQSLPSTIHF